MSKRTTSELMPNIKPANSVLTPTTFWKEIQPIPEKICRWTFGGIKCRTVYRPSRHNQIHCQYHNNDVVVRLKYLKDKYPDLEYIEVETDSKKEKENSLMGTPRLKKYKKSEKNNVIVDVQSVDTKSVTVVENLLDKSTQPTIEKWPNPTLNELQEQIHDWSIRNFGPVPNDSFDYEMICTILMIAESFGRCCHAALKTAENIRGDAGTHRQEYFRGISEIRQAINSGTVLQARDFYRVITKNGYRLSSLIGMWEESAEMLRAMYDGNDLEVSDAIGDMMVFFADFCGRNSRSLEDKFVETWDKVKKRDWQNNKLTGQVDS